MYAAILRALALACVLVLEPEAMKTSDAGKTFLMLHEGVRTTAYRDAVGIWTIGIGHTAAAGPPAPHRGMKITTTEVMEILTRDLAKFEREVLRVTRGIPLKQHEFDALVSLCFNIGPGNFERSSVLKHLLAKRYIRAAESFTLWNKAKGRVLAGLTRRRREERKLFLAGVYTGVTITDGRSSK